VTPALLLLAAGLASYSGFACLALAMPRHWTQASGQRVDVVPRRRWLRPCGFLMLGVAYALCVYRDGPSFGSLLWAVLISAAAIAVALTLAWRPQWLLPAVWHPRHEAKKGT
jgi:hypothetical protein